ncbi:MAG: sugar phosphate isomerase/epimerase family protein [Phycisphaerae bacterium]
MKLAFSTNAFKKTSLEEAVAAIAASGYGGVEIMADVPHAYPPHMSDARVADLCAQLESLKLRISNINAFTFFAIGDTLHPSWIEKDAALREKRIRHTDNCIRMAAALGAKTISLEPGGPLDGMSRVQALELYQDGLMQVLPLAQQCNITLLVEPEPGLMLQTTAECVEFLQRVNHPHLRMNCDLGHLYCVGENPAESFVRSYAWVGHVHLEDIAHSRVHQHLIPGRGAMDWTAIFKAFRQTDYQGWATVELYPYETTAQAAAEEAFTFLQKFM